MWLGDYTEDHTSVVCMFTTHSSTGAPVAPLSAFEAADVAIYKNGNAAQKTTTNGVTMTSPFDSVTGLHCIAIDTSNDTGDVGFWTAGSVYTLVLSPDETVDSITVVKVIGQFGIEAAGDIAAIKAQTDKLTFDGANHIVADARKISTSATAADNLEGGATALVLSTCASGSTTTTIATNLTEATNDHFNGRVISFTSGALLGQSTSISDYDGTTKVLTVVALTEAPASTDAFVIS